MKKYILSSVLLSVLVILISLLFFKTGITSKLIGKINNVISNNEKDYKFGYYPKINFVFNSSGEKYVNTDVSIIIDAEGISNIEKVEYSYDLKNWIKLDDKYDSNKVTAKIVFKDNINEKVFIRVLDDEGYKSYAYKTYVKIDKTSPTIKFLNIGNNKFLDIKDNVALAKLQFSNDKMNWIDEKINGSSYRKKVYDIDYKYVRAVDETGNISDVLIVK